MEMLVAIGAIAIFAWFIVGGAIRLSTEKVEVGVVPEPSDEKLNVTTRREKSETVTGPEVYRICYLRGMDVHDLQMIETDPDAMKRVRSAFEKDIQTRGNSGRSRNEIFADAMQHEHEYTLKDSVVRVVLMWAKNHSLAQFSSVSNIFDEEYLHLSRRLPEQVVNTIYDLETVTAERAFMEGPVITRIPDAVFRLPNLKTLIMGRGGYPELFNVQLENVPPAIAEAKKLESLHLQHCGLSELPSYIFTASLRELKIGGNDIKIIPNAIGKATNLEMLTAWMNDLEYISAEIGNLRKLKRIDIWGSKRLRLPESIVNLGKMDSLFIADAQGLTAAQFEWLRSNGMSEEVIRADPNRKAAHGIQRDLDEDIPF